jgi:hypothetical protein
MVIGVIKTHRHECIMFNSRGSFCGFADFTLISHLSHQIRLIIFFLVSVLFARHHRNFFDVGVAAQSTSVSGFTVSHSGSLNKKNFVASGDLSRYQVFVSSCMTHTNECIKFCPFHNLVININKKNFHPMLQTRFAALTLFLCLCLAFFLWSCGEFRTQINIHTCGYARKMARQLSMSEHDSGS